MTLFSHSGLRRNEFVYGSLWLMRTRTTLPSSLLLSLNLAQNLACGGLYLSNH